MTKSRFANLDILISSSVEYNIKKESAEFLAIDSSSVQENQEFKAKIMKSINKTHPGVVKMRLKTVLVASLILISILLTACVCIPTIREKVFGPVIRWYKEYFVVDYTATTPETPEEFTPPTTIENRAILTYIPMGCYAEYVEDDLDTSKMVIIFDDNGNILFVFDQYTIYEEVMTNNTDGCVVTNLYINGHEAMLIEYPMEVTDYMLIWSDGIYKYYLYGYAANSEDIIKIGQGVELPTE